MLNPKLAIDVDGSQQHSYGVGPNVVPATAALWRSMRSALFLNRWRVKTTRSCMFAQQGRYNLAWISSFKSDCREVFPGVR